MVLLSERYQRPDDVTLRWASALLVPQGWSSAVSQYLWNREHALKRLLLSHPSLKAGKEALFQNSPPVFRGGKTN